MHNFLAKPRLKSPECKQRASFLGDPLVPVLEDILIDLIEPVMGVFLNHNLLGSSLVNDWTVVL